MAIHFSVNGTLVKMIFCAWCYCNWVFWKKRETIFTEMCKFVAELTVKMRTPNCFCILSGKQWCMRIYRFSGGEGISMVLLGHGCMGAPPRNEQQTLGYSAACSLAEVRVHVLSQINLFVVFFRRNKIWRRSKAFQFSKKQKAKPQKWAVGVRTPLGNQRRGWEPNSDFRVVNW